MKDPSTHYKTAYPYELKYEEDNTHFFRNVYEAIYQVIYQKARSRYPRTEVSRLSPFITHLVSVMFLWSSRLKEIPQSPWIKWLV